MKKVLKVLFIGLRITLFMLLLAVFGIISPMAHKGFMRGYVGDKVVEVSYPGKGGGTGFHVKAKSGKVYVVTNAHVCLVSDGNDYVYLKEVGSKTYVKKKIIKRMKDHDLCAIEAIENKSGLGVANKVYVGEIVALLGHPALRPLTLSMGEIIGKRNIELIFGLNLPKDYCIGKTLQVKNLQNGLLKLTLMMYGGKTVCVANLTSTMLNAIAYKGNSGSPVVDIFGRVVGVLFAGSSQPTDSYLVPLPKLKEFLKDL